MFESINEQTPDYIKKLHCRVTMTTLDTMVLVPPLGKCWTKEMVERRHSVLRKLGASWNHVRPSVTATTSSGSLRPTSWCSWWCLPACAASLWWGRQEMTTPPPSLEGRERLSNTTTTVSMGLRILYNIRMISSFNKDFMCRMDHNINIPDKEPLWLSARCCCKLLSE